MPKLSKVFRNILNFLGAFALVLVTTGTGFENPSHWEKFWSAPERGPDFQVCSRLQNPLLGLLTLSPVVIENCQISASHSEDKNEKINPSSDLDNTESENIF